MLRSFFLRSDNLTASHWSTRRSLCHPSHYSVFIGCSEELHPIWIFRGSGGSAEEIDWDGILPISQFERPHIMLEVKQFETLPSIQKKIILWAFPLTLLIQ